MQSFASTLLSEDLQNAINIGENTDNSYIPIKDKQFRNFDWRKSVLL